MGASIGAAITEVKKGDARVEPNISLPPALPLAALASSAHRDPYELFMVPVPP